ncbi:MAG: response regulator [Dissulfurimicrobium sp.]|uniref:response regulator n=1 Tax=Dissulfurimicrobium sp. TaxID=2022436 RepID=UPI00404AA897
MNTNIAKKINNIWQKPLKNGQNGEFNAHIEDIGLPALVQLACIEGMDRVLIARGDRAEGEIFFSNGEIIHATYKGLDAKELYGEDAFFSLVRDDPRSFLLKKSAAPKKTIQAPWNFLLLEALRRKDEATSKKVSMPCASSTILVVNDSNAICMRLEEILRKDCGVETVIAYNNYRDALEKLSAYRPGLIAVDIDTPKMDGKDLAIKHIMFKSQAPVLLFSSLNQSTFPRVMEFLRLGAIDFIPKPANDQEWLQVSERFKRVLASLNGLDITNIRRARQPRGKAKKTRPGPPADKLLVIISGIGGLVELQKILPTLPSDGSLSITVFQDMARNAVELFASAMDRLTDINISHLRTSAPLLSAQCWLTNWDESWEIISEGGGTAIQQVTGFLPGLESQSPGLDTFGLIKTASMAFGPNLAVLVLSGTTLDLKAGLDEAVSHGCHVWLQAPESALYPGPLDEIHSWELEEACVEMEEVGKLVYRWCMGEALWQEF